MRNPTAELAEALVALNTVHADSWQARAACRQPDLDLKGARNADGEEVDPFFADRRGVAAAQRVCDSCPVEAQCLDFALTRGLDHGVWGRESGRNRMRLRRSRGEAETAVSMSTALAS